MILSTICGMCENIALEFVRREELLKYSDVAVVAVREGKEVHSVSNMEMKLPMG